VVGGQHDERLVELPQRLELVEHSTELLVGDLGGTVHVNLARADRAVVAFGVLVCSPHMARLVDAAERDEHARPGLVLHHRHRGVRHPHVAPEMCRVGTRHEPIGFLRIHERRERELGAVVERIPRQPSGCFLPGRAPAENRLTPAAPVRFGESNGERRRCE